MDVKVIFKYKFLNRKNIKIHTYYIDVMCGLNNFEIIERCLRSFKTEKPNAILIGIYIEI